MVALRLPTEPREEFLEKYKKELSGGYGSVMNEYAVVPKSLLKKTYEVKEYFEISNTYAGSLKPKPTKKKGKS